MPRRNQSAQQRRREASRRARLVDRRAQPNRNDISTNDAALRLVRRGLASPQILDTPVRRKVISHAEVTP